MPELKATSPTPEPSPVHWLLRDTWKLEVCLEALGSAFDIPFQALNTEGPQQIVAHSRDKANAAILSEDSLRSLREAPDDTESFIRWYGENQVAAARYADIVLDLLRTTRPCYSGPISRVLRDCDALALWEGRYFLQVLGDPAIAASDGYGVSKKAWFDVTCLLGYFLAPEVNALIVSWPIAPLTTALYLGEQPTIGVDLVSKCVRALTEAGLKAPMAPENLARLVDMRGGLTHDDFASRLEMAKEAFQALLSLDLDSDVELGRANLQRITSALAFASIMTQYRQTEGMTAEQEPTAEMEFKLLATHPEAFRPIPSCSLRVLAKTADTAMKVQIVPSSNDFKLVEQPAGNYGTGQLLARAASGDGYTIDHKQQQHVDSTYSWFLDTIQTRKNAHDFETFLLLRIWCVDAFGDMAMSLRTLRGDDAVHLEPESIGSQIAQRIADVVGADVVTLQYYNRRMQRVQLFGIHHTNRNIVDGLQQFFGELFSKKFLTDSNLRETSLVMRALDSSAPQACRAFDATTRQADPPGHYLIVMPQRFGQICSGNAVPINVYGRPWGVLAVGGNRAYQFTASTATTLTDLSNLFASQLYNHWLLHNLDAMNTAAAAPHLTAGERYGQICESLCDVLLADAVVIWVKNINVEFRFDAVSWVNRPDLDQLVSKHDLQSIRKARNDQRNLSDSHGIQLDHRPVIGDRWPISFSTHDSSNTSFSGQAIREDALWRQARIGSAPLDGAWLQKAHTRNLQKQGFKSLCIVPVRFGGETRACFSLLSRSDQLYDERWQHLLRLVSDEVAVMIETIETRNALELNLFMPLRHEIRPALSRLRERVKTFDKALKNKGMKQSPNFHKMAMLQSDLSGVTDHLSWRIENIVTKKRDRPIYEYFQDEIILQARKRRDEYNGEGVSLRKLYFEIASSLQGQFENKRLKHGFHGSERMEILMDRVSAEEILRNLLENAAKYSALHDEIVGELRETAGFTLTISNTGESLKEDELVGRNIFGRGYRGTMARKNNLDGSGLGLYYVDRLCSLYGISVQYRSIQLSRRGLSRHQFTLIIPRNRMQV